MRMIATEDRLDMGVAARVRSFHSIVSPWAAIVFLFFRAALGTAGVSQRLRDHDLGARVASRTKQPAIHGTQHTIRATTDAVGAQSTLILRLNPHVGQTGSACRRM